MKITLFTSNQPRHINLANTLSKICDELFCIKECNTVFPGQIDDFFKKSDAMQQYFSHVINAEKNIFDEISFSSENVRTLSIKSGDINRLSKQQLSSALESDVYVVFGASYIKGWLIDFLLSRNAINIHMGVSPYYRGSSCNFWALYDNNPSYVGATLHKLSKGLDSGDMLLHCIPTLEDDDTLFDFTMRSVDIAHKALVSKISSGEIFKMPSVQQDKSLEIRYTRNSDFNDKVANEFLKRTQSIKGIDLKYPKLIQPFFG